MEMLHGQFQDCARAPLTRGTPPPKTQESKTCHQILSHLRRPIHLTRLKETLSRFDLPHSQAEAQHGRQRNNQSLSGTCEQLTVHPESGRKVVSNDVNKKREIDLRESVYTYMHTHGYIFKKYSAHLLKFFLKNYSSNMSAGK